MKDKQFRKFMSLFDCLPYAGWILWGKYEDCPEEKELLTSEVNAAFRVNRAILDDQENTFLIKLIDETKSNFYATEYHEKYATKLVRSFIHVAPFFSGPPELEEDNEIYPDETSCYCGSYSFLIRFEKEGGNIEDCQTDVERYIVSCQILLASFAAYLDGCCLDFDLDLEDIQANQDIYIQLERDFESLIFYGYGVQLEKVLSQKPSTTEQPPSTSPNATDLKTALLFDESLLNGFYAAFDGFLWESTAYETFKDWFRVNTIGKPLFIKDMTTYFCYAFSKIEHRIMEEYKPKNINKWIMPIIHGNNYSGLKNRKTVTEKCAAIDRKLALLLLLD